MKTLSVEKRKPAISCQTVKTTVCRTVWHTACHYFTGYLDTRYHTIPSHSTEEFDDALILRQQMEAGFSLVASTKMAAFTARVILLDFSTSNSISG